MARSQQALTLLLHNSYEALTPRRCVSNGAHGILCEAFAHCHARITPHRCAPARIYGALYAYSRRKSVVASKIKPVGDRVVVRPAAKEEMTSSGLIIPD